MPKVVHQYKLLWNLEVLGDFYQFFESFRKTIEKIGYKLFQVPS